MFDLLPLTSQFSDSIVIFERMLLPLIIELLGVRILLNSSHLHTNVTLGSAPVGLLEHYQEYYIDTHTGMHIHTSVIGSFLTLWS